MEAIESGKQLDKVFIQRQIQGELADELWDTMKKHNVNAQIVPPEKLDRITRKNHQGVVAFLSPVDFHDIYHVVPALFEEGKTPLILMMDSISDVRNFGALVRTAECAGVHAIVIPEKGNAPVNSDSAKTSAGAIFRIPICKVPSMKQTIKFLQSSGILTVGCTEKTSSDIYAVDFQKPMAIVMGSEDTGLSPNVMKQCDALASIPMMGEIGSLNVSVAGGVILYESVRQRKAIDA